MNVSTKKIISLLLSVVLLVCSINTRAYAVNSIELSITVTDGSNPISGASVTLAQVSDAVVDTDETEPLLLKMLTMNTDEDWEKGFLESVNRPYNLNPGQEHTKSGSKIYRSGLLPIEGSEYIVIPTPAHYDSANGGYYKWKIYWYGTNAETGATTAEAIDFVACATEQSDFSTTNKFSVPEGACYVRLTVASVLSSGTESNFPEAKFLADGGLSVELYRDESTVRTEMLNSTGYLEVGSIDSTTGNFANNDIYCRTNAPFSTAGASMLAVSFPETDSVSYKWQVLFYNNDTFVAAASEQNELGDHPYFDIPEEANTYKIIYTSVVSDTETAIDLDAFCATGGFQVTLYGAEASKETQEWITKYGITDENGKIAFSVPAGADYMYTVRADDYVTASETVTAGEYENGLTVTLEKQIDYSDALDIAVNDGENGIPNATIKVEQIFESSLMHQDTVTLEYVGGAPIKGSGVQSGAIYGHYFVQVEKGKLSSDGYYVVWFHIFDLNTGLEIATTSMAGDYHNGRYSQYKNNNANFGTTFHDENDPFPLLYVSSAYDYRTVAVRLYQDASGNWLAEQKQIIDYRESMHNNDGFYSCNVLLDNDNGYMYLTPIDQVYTAPAEKQWFYKFDMPEYEEGSIIYISPDMALEDPIETAYEYAPQGCCILNGKIYQVFGLGTAAYPAKMGVFNIATGEYETKINLNDLNCAYEPESCAYYNDSIYFCTVSCVIYKVTPNAYLPKETDNLDTLLSETILNKDEDWEEGFLESSSTPNDLNPGQEHGYLGSKVYRSGLISVEGADYINIPVPNHYDSANSGYYKWKIHWYGPNAQIGATTVEAIDFVAYASEQTDFDTTRTFVVPDGAAYARICVASVLASGTERPFPEDKFLADGGLTVQLYDTIGDPVTTLWVDRTVTTDGAGSVRLGVVPGASFYITVTANGYKTVTKMVTAIDYLEGLTVTLEALPYMPGDADGDGDVTAEDAALLKKYRAGLAELSEDVLARCDLDNNGRVDAYDAYLIQLRVAGKIDKFPIEN